MNLTALTNLAKTLGGSLISAITAWLLSNGATDQLHTLFPAIPAWIIVTGLGGMALHGAATALQSLQAQLNPPAPRA